MNKILAEINLTDAPVGRIFDFGDSDKTIEDKYLADWVLPLTPHKYWQRQSPYILDEEEDVGTVLECERSVEAAMTTGSMDWGDYIVESRVRVIGQGAKGGILARYQTSRHYYLLTVECSGRLVLYRRDNTEWHVLAETPLEVDRRRYHTLGLSVEGACLRAYLDGVEVFDVTDGQYLTGGAGIHNQGRVRFEDVKITGGGNESENYEIRRTARANRAAEFQSKFPQERFLARYPKPNWPHEVSQLRRVGPEGTWGFLMYNSDSVFSAEFASRYGSGTIPRVGVSDTEGNLLWGQEIPIRFPYAIDVDGDGREEILGIMDDERMVVLSSENGEIVNEAPLPSSCPFQGHRGQRIAPDLFPWYPADLSGNGRQQEFVIKDDRESRGGRTLWAYDGSLNLLWAAQVGRPRYGHRLAMCDIDGDGREEILAGFHLFDADGNLLWKCLETELNDDDHVDEVQLGLYGPNQEPRGCGTNGDDGFFILDGGSGEVIARHNAGHVQGCSAGNYLHDRPGMDYCVGTRWGNYGVLSVLDTEGELVKMWQPDKVSQGGPAVRWTGDGRDFIFLSTSEEAFGLWDGHGNVCVRLDCPELPSKGSYGIQKGRGDVMDVDGDGCDELVFTYPDEAFVYKASD
ncbi:MAG: hypothetical protein CME25_00105 [Gemmatimonadetes bacterium]|nr:hypothetical protein [Gemmatimonadota bacterium]